jgi:hypothetical protein
MCWLLHLHMTTTDGFRNRSLHQTWLKLYLCLPLAASLSATSLRVYSDSDTAGAVALALEPLTDPRAPSRRANSSDGSPPKRYSAGRKGLPAASRQAARRQWRGRVRDHPPRPSREPEATWSQSPSALPSTATHPPAQKWLICGRNGPAHILVTPTPSRTAPGVCDPLDEVRHRDADRPRGRGSRHQRVRGRGAGSRHDLRHDRGMKRLRCKAGRMWSPASDGALTFCVFKCRVDLCVSSRPRRESYREVGPMSASEQ